MWRTVLPDSTKVRMTSGLPYVQTMRITSAPSFQNRWCEPLRDPDVVERPQTQHFAVNRAHRLTRHTGDALLRVMEVHGQARARLHDGHAGRDILRPAITVHERDAAHALSAIEYLRIDLSYHDLGHLHLPATRRHASTHRPNATPPAPLSSPQGHPKRAHGPTSTTRLPRGLCHPPRQGVSGRTFTVRRGSFSGDDMGRG